MQAEQVPIFKDGSFKGVVERGNLYESSENDHRTVHNLVYLPIKPDMHPERMWVQVRGSQTNYLRGHYVAAASGHLNMTPDGEPETFEEATRREVTEELFGGTPPAEWYLQPLGGSFFFTPNYPGYKGGTKEVATYVSESDGNNFNPSTAEVAHLLAVPVGELKEMARDPNSPLHPELREILNRKMKRIGIVGTYSAGKTTLTDALSQRIHGAVGITEDVRTYVKDYFGKKGIQELTPDQFIELEHMLFRHQTLASRSAEVAIVDSTPIGCPVYLQNYGLLAQNGHRFDDSVVEAWIEKTSQTLREYDAIIYLPPEIPYENDGFRTGPQFRGPLDEGFRAAIAGHPRAIEVTGYVEGDKQAGVNQRVNQVIEHCLANGILSPDLIKE